MLFRSVLQAQQAQQPPPLPPPPPPPPPAPVVRTAASIITDFVRISPPTFSGEGDPILAEKWEEQILKHLDALEITDDATRIRLATFQFRDSAETWWRSVKDTREVSKLTWKDFSALFMLKPSKYTMLGNNYTKYQNISSCSHKNSINSPICTKHNTNDKILITY